jgi:hypothetical protein
MEIEMPGEEETKNVNNQDEPKKDENAQPAAEPQKSENEEHMIPKSRLDDEIQKRKDLEKRLSAMEKAHNDAEEKRLKESEDYKALYEKTAAELADAKPKAEKAETYEATLKETLAAEIEAVPTERRTLIPEELSVEAQLRWISKNRGLLSKAEPFDIGAGRKGNKQQNTVELTPEEKAEAKKFGYTEEQYAEYKNK